MATSRIHHRHACATRKDADDIPCSKPTAHHAEGDGTRYGEASVIQQEDTARPCGARGGGYRVLVQEMFPDQVRVIDECIHFVERYLAVGAPVVKTRHQLLFAGDRQ